MTARWFIPLVLLVLGVAGCNNAAGECSTGSRWTGGDEESPLMHPGMDCIACHTDRGEGPQYSVAGTVMGDLADPDDCDGIEGVLVRILDADAQAHEVVTNAAGNFFLTEVVPLPYTVELELDGATSAMAASQSDGACATCHTPEGANDAPGRITAP